MPIQPGAAYLLATLAVPDEARQKVLEKAEASGETIFAAAKEIAAEVRKRQRPRRQKAVPADKLGLRLVAVLERYRDRWGQKELTELARHLREFPDSLESQKAGKKTMNE